MYPPEHHALRDLDLTSEQVSAEHAVTVAPVTDAVRNRAGAAGVGFLAALVDANAAMPALLAARPDWTATADLSLHAGGWLTGNCAVSTGRLVRAGSKIVVVEVEVRDGGDAAGPDALDDLGDVTHLRRVATGLLTFARIPGSASVATAIEPDAIGTRRRLEPSPNASRAPIMERIGLRVVDAARGVVELDNGDYVRNSFGSINGGVLGMVFQGAAEAAVPDLVATDVQIHYLAQGDLGPARTATTVLRRTGDHAVCSISVHDAGREDRLLALATLTLQAPPVA